MIETLAGRYDAFYEALRHNRHADAREAFGSIAGVEANGDPTDARTASRALSAPLIRYDVPRAIDLVALRERARDAAKFEDLTLATTRGLVEKLQRWGLHTLTVGPYTRRMDVTLSVEDAPRDAALAGRYTVFAGRGDEAIRVSNAEHRRTPEGTREAGLRLGYPRCCVARFVAVEKSAEAARDGVNEAALRAFLDTGAPPWELNPLSDLSPVGFMPCRAACPEALAFARRLLATLERVDPEAHARTRTVLSRPVLFVRYTMFWALDGAAEREGAVRYTRAVAQDDPTLGELARWRDAHLGDALAEGDRVAAGERSVEVTREGATVATWRLTKPVVPRLVAWASG